MLPGSFYLLVSFSMSVRGFSQVQRKINRWRLSLGPIATTDTLSSNNRFSSTWDYLDVLFDLDLPHGRCVAVQPRSDLSKEKSLTGRAVEASKDHWVRSILHKDEIAFGLELASDEVRQTFFLGRLAMRKALQHETIETDFAILRDGYGRPTLPPGYLGSISHKKSTGAAMVSKDLNPRVGLGVDIEYSTPGPRSIARRVLTDDEQCKLGTIPGMESDEEVLLRFSLKESLYKAMHPLICQYVGFKEADVQPTPDGGTEIKLNLKSGDHDRFEKVEAHWRRVGDLFLSSALVQLGDEAQPTECSTDTIHLGRNS